PPRNGTFGVVGRAVAGVEVRLSGDGELLVRSDALFSRYVGDPAATDRALGGGWLHTGDRAKILSSGEIVLLGRMQSLLSGANGEIADTAAIGARIRDALGDSDVVFSPPVAGGSIELFVALHGSIEESNRAPEPIAGDDPRHQAVARLLDELDESGVV